MNVMRRDARLHGGAPTLRRAAERAAAMAGEHQPAPKWRVLLALFVGQGRAGGLSLTSCCAAAGLRPSEVLAHLQALERQGLVTRRNVADDLRCQLLCPTTRAETLLGTYLGAVTLSRNA